VSSEDIKKAQALQQQAIMLDEQLRLYKQRLIEVDSALKVIKKAKERGENHVFQFLGANVMIKRDIDEVIDELSEEREFLKDRVKKLEEHAREIKKQLIDISKRIETARVTQGA